MRVPTFPDVADAATAPITEARPTERRNASWPRILVECVALVAATRLALFAVGSMTRAYYGLPSGWIDVWKQYDAVWYLDIATQGYAHSPFLSGGVMGIGNLAFFPAYPMLVQLLGLLFPAGFVLATAVSMLCFTLAAALLYRMADERYGAGTGFWTAVVLAVIPGSFVFGGVMTESLYLLVTAAASRFAHSRRFVPAALAAGVASATRPLGVLLAPCLALDELLQSRLRAPSPPSWRGIALLALAPLTLLAHVAHLWWSFGDGYAFMSIQAVWWHYSVDPFSLLWSALRQGSWINAGVTIAGLLGLAIVLAGLRRLSAGEWAFAAVNIVVPLFNASPSMPRYVIGQFPLYLILGRVAARHSTFRNWLIPVFALVNLALMANWSPGEGVFI